MAVLHTLKRRNSSSTAASERRRSVAAFSITIAKASPMTQSKSRFESLSNRTQSSQEPLGNPRVLFMTVDAPPEAENLPIIHHPEPALDILGLIDRAKRLSPEDKPLGGNSAYAFDLAFESDQWQVDWQEDSVPWDSTYPEDGKAEGVVDEQMEVR
jgi:hypothetical protein